MARVNDIFTDQLLHELEEKKNEFDIEEWATTQLEEFRVTDSIKCTICGQDKPEADMLKVFRTRANGRETTNKGICKRCWNFDLEL